MDIESFFQFYRVEFLPAYADLVSFVLKKPKQILTEIENTFSHVAQYFNPTLNSEVKEENLKKAHDHLQRATLDCYKLLWTQMDKELKKIYFDDKARIFAINIREDVFLKKFDDFRTQAKNARIEEIKNVGLNPLSALDKYKETIKTGKYLLSNVDKNKLSKLNTFRAVITTKESIISIAIGVVSGFIAGLLTAPFL
ncbi:MAG: hypothetical protein CHKLHMKO_00349 [Candidatus Argoarchaeum ethanivorans]|uniref:Uncharacterized protein n=1 Tax=Candidatus Argoarchaeum ethanivorans TaxID=2608793 RepID=A0A811TAR0_9EURY|nr:MAG: hypothetical protein CHKLHMKO_00349 [Candidatus Argoarchaeum ethanivorans]